MDRGALLLSMLLLMEITSSNGQETSIMKPCINCNPEKEVCSYFDDSGNVIECPQISEKKFTISKDSSSKYEVGNGNIQENKEDDSQNPSNENEDDQNKQPKTQNPEPSTKEKKETNVSENISIKPTSKQVEELMFEDEIAPEKADESGGPLMEKILTKKQRVESLKDAQVEKDTVKENNAKPTDRLDESRSSLVKMAAVKGLINSFKGEKMENDKRKEEDEKATDGVDESSSSFVKMADKGLTNLKGAFENNNAKEKEETRKDQERHDLFGGSSSSSSSASSESSQSSEETGRRCPVGQIFDRKSRICKILANLQCRIDARNRNWQQLLRTDNNGNALSGAKADLLEAARKGSRIKIRTSTYSAEVQNCRIINQDICCQGLLHGSYQTWEMFQSNVYWWMINVCTTGNWHMVRYFVGGGYLSQTKTRGSFMWYVLRNNDGSYPEPLLSTDSSGMILSGTNCRVKRAVKDGKSLSVVQKNLFLIPIQNVQLKQRTVSAQHVWSVSQRIAGNHIEFQSNAYWWFNLLTNLGSRDMSRWSLGFHTSRSQTNDVVALDWFAGDCWMKAFTTTAGLSQPLARLYLRSKVEAGLPIKVKVGRMYREVDNVMVSGNHISAQIISQLAREDVDTFASDLNWEFSTLSTRGVVRTYRPLVGSSSMASEGTTKTSQDITWYFDSRKWDLLFHVSDTGTTISGSALAVRNAVEQGADVRVGYRQAGDTGFRFSTADNINFGPSPDLSVQAMRHLRDNNIPGDEFDFGNDLVWSFLLLNTKGFIRKTDWIVGEHVNDGRSMERAEIKFFVNL